VVTVPQALQKAGYRTGLFGKWHLGDEEEYLPQNRGFDEVLMHGAGGIGQYGWGDFKANTENTYFDNVLLHNDTVVRTKGFCTDLFFEAALAWIRKQEKTDDPWFALISLNAPHGPMIAPDSCKERFLEEGYDDKTAGRYGMIENIDANVGRLMGRLAQWQVLGDTLVIFMTDNGMAMPMIKRNGKQFAAHNAGMRGAKNSPEEGGTHVPSFWHWQGVLGEGVDIPALSAHIDLYRTFCELAGVEVPESKLPPGGRSLVPLLEDPQAEWPDRELFVHCGRWNAGDREKMKYIKCAVRTQQWRLVDNHRLYDISQDPGQKQDVAAQHPEVVEKLRAAYDQWWKSTEQYLVNEGLSRVKPGTFSLQRLYRKQHEEGCIPEWQPDDGG
jgi:arylsulfatase